MYRPKHKCRWTWIQVNGVRFFKVYYTGDNPDIPKNSPIIERPYSYSSKYGVLAFVCGITVVLLPLNPLFIIAHMLHVRNAHKASLDELLREFDDVIDHKIAQDQSGSMRALDAISVKDPEVNQSACSTDEFIQMNNDIETKILELRSDCKGSGVRTALLPQYSTNIRLPNKIKDLEQVAIRQYNRGNLDNCLAAAQKIIRKDQNNFMGWRMQGMALFMNGLLSEAKKSLEKAVSLNSNDATAQLVYAQNCELLGKTILADDAFTRAAAHPEVEMNKGFSILLRKKITLAGAYFKIMQQEKKDPHGYAHLGLSVCNLYDNNLNVAQEHYALFLQKRSQFPIRLMKGLRLRVLALANLGFWQESIETLDTLLMRFPKYEWVRAARPVIQALRANKSQNQGAGADISLSSNPSTLFSHPTFTAGVPDTNENEITVSHDSNSRKP